MKKGLTIWSKRSSIVPLSPLVVYIVNIVIVVMVVSGAGALAAQAATQNEAPPPVRATVDRTRIATGESVRLMVTVSGGDGEVDTSPITEFKVHSRGTSSHIQIINGRTSKEVVYTYLLIPKGLGDLTIPALVVEINDELYKTDPITIRVAEPAAQGGDRTEADVFVTATVSAQQPFVGQQFIYTFSLYNAVQVTDARFQPPEFKGFSAKEVEQRRSYRKTIKGREFAVVEMDYVLVPLAAGALTIAPAVLQVGIVSQERRRSRSAFDDFFNSPLFDRGSVRPKIVQTPSLEVMVQPLPPFEGPGVFSGLVGQFDMQGEVQNPRLQVGDSTTFTLTVQGKGNIMDAPLPDLTLPQGFKSYPDTPQEEIRIGQEGYEGRKVFRVALVPLKTGKFSFAPVTLSYFDTSRGAYQALRVNLPDMYVTPAAPSDAAPLLVTPQAPGQTKEAVAFTGRDILPLKEGLDALKPQRPMSPLAFLLWLAAPAAVFFGLLVFQHARRPDTSPAARMKVKAHEAFRAAVAGIRADRSACSADVLTHLYQALTAAIFAAVGRSGEALTWKEAEALLMESGMDAERAGQAADLLRSIESAKFSGAGLPWEQGSRILEELGHLMKRLAP